MAPGGGARPGVGGPGVTGRWSRETLLEQLRRGTAPSAKPWDVLIIGGGATGLGAAVEAVRRGYRTVLLEAGDFAQGTSSRSTKLIHGGLRYLRQGRLGLVREALTERARLLRTAPHVVRRRTFLVPFYHPWDRAMMTAGVGLYSVLAGEPRLPGTLDPAAAGAAASTLRGDGLRGGITYEDGQFDDARLAWVLAATAIESGALALNHCRVEGWVRRGRRVVGVVARDRESGDELEVPAWAVINATGVWCDTLRRMDNAAYRPLVRPSRGTHLVVDRSFLPGESAVLIPRTDDGRVLFAIPWAERVLLGTTDMAVDEADAEPVPSDEEVDYLLEHAARYLDPAPQRADVRAAFAGLRPLVGGGGATASLSREHHIEVAPSGVVTVIGGKWTTYRSMAEQVVDRAVKASGLTWRPPAPEAPLYGCPESGGGDAAGSLYGSAAPEVDAIAAAEPSLDEPMHPRLPYRWAEVVHAARNEMARTVEDVLARRTRALTLDAAAAAECAGTAARLLAAELGRDEAWCQEQEAAFCELAARYQVTK